MNPQPINTAFPHLKNDMTIVKAQMESTGVMPQCSGIDSEIVTEIEMCFILYLLNNQRLVEAEQRIETILNDDERSTMLPHLYCAWLWLANMSLLIEQANYTLALSAAENALTTLTEIIGKRNEDFLAIVASLLYNLALTHHATADNNRASKELTKSQQLLERLNKRNNARFAPLLLMAVEASTEVIKSRTKQMNVLAHYQTTTELYTKELSSDDAHATREAMSNLVDTLSKQGAIMLEMGNSRNAVKYYTKALRYQKKLGEKLGHRELTLSIGLAKALMRLINRRTAAEELLKSLLPLAKRLEATAEVTEIETLLNNKNKNFNIMTLLKSIFIFALIFVNTITATAQLVVGHRGSQWGVENTEAAFVNGARAGAWGLECDICTTADGTFVISHDSNFKRLGGSDTNLSDMTTTQVLSTPLKQTRYGIVYAGKPITLGSYLDICNEYHVVPVIEIKHSSLIDNKPKDREDPCFDGIPALIRLIDLKGCTERAVIISFMPSVIDFIHRHYPDVQVQVLAGDGNIDEWVDWCIDRNLDLDVLYSMLTPQAVQRMHQAGLKVNVWTVNGVDDFNKMRDMGVDYITTDTRFPNELK